MSRSLLAGAALVALAALVPQAPAMAQHDAPSITVRAPAVNNAGQPRNSVHPPLQLIANVSVETGDLDLRTSYGRDVLDRRVRLAADVACDRLDAIDPPAGVGAALNHDSGDCRHLAVKNARPQIRTAIAFAG